MGAVNRVWRSGRGDWKLYLLSVFSLAVAFVCLASALLVVVNLQAVEERWARAGRISVYLRDGTPDDALVALKHATEQTPGVASARYLSSADARKDVLDDGLSGALAALPADAFPASLELSLRADVSNVEVAAMAEKLRAIPSVESVETYERWTAKVASLVRGGVTASAILALVVLAAVVSVIGSTMRLALHRRRIEVEVLKLVGATDRFVRGPFLVEGAIQGALGALSSVVLLGVLYLVVRARFDDDLGLLLGVSPTFLPWEVVAGMIVSGAFLGATSALVGVRRLSAI